MMPSPRHKSPPKSASIPMVEIAALISYPHDSAAAKLHLPHPAAACQASTRPHRSPPQNPASSSPQYRLTPTDTPAFPKYFTHLSPASTTPSPPPAAGTSGYYPHISCIFSKDQNLSLGFTLTTHFRKRPRLNGAARPNYRYYLQLPPRDPCNPPHDVSRYACPPLGAPPACAPHRPPPPREASHEVNAHRHQCGHATLRIRRSTSSSSSQTISHASQ